MTNRNLTCAEVDERLGDYLEGALDDASVADLELHLSGCTACTALVHDFERITRDAATLPALTRVRVSSAATVSFDELQLEVVGGPARRIRWEIFRLP